MILCEEFYATAALVGSLSHVELRYLSVPEVGAEALTFRGTFSLRASAIIFGISMGPLGEFIRFSKIYDAHQPRSRKEEKPRCGLKNDWKTMFAFEP